MGIWNAECNSKARLEGKTAIITGCNTGIGKCTVEDFYRRGARVIMACRTVEKAEEAAADIRKQCEGAQNLGEIVIEKLDLTSLKSISSFSKSILEKENRIDLLVNNAGVMMTPLGKTEDGFETQIGTNHLGHFYLTLLLLPKIIKSAPSRIVNLSSLAHKSATGRIKVDDLNWENRTYSPYEAYNQSKLANLLFTKELTRRLKEANINGVTTYAVHPGVIDTDLARHFKESVPKPVSWVFSNVVTSFLKTPKQGAQTTIHCSVDEKAGNETGLYYGECKVINSSSASKNMKDAENLWNLSWRMVGLEEDYNPFV